MIDYTKLPRGGQGYPVLGEAQEGTRILETYNMDVDKSNNKTFLSNSNDQPSKRRIIDISWLPSASETYHISPNPKDYILVPVPIVTVDIPNRNTQAFPFEEVTYFDHRHGMMVFNTFAWKPTFADHDNQDPLKAKGVHFDVWMEYVPNYKVWKINVLTAWDRTKYTKLVEDIAKRRRTGYSMGSLVEYFPLVGGTLVRTQFGWVPIEQTSPGTIVETRGKTSRKCQGVIFQGYRPTREISTVSGFQLDLEDTHPVLTLTDDFEMKYIPAHEVTKGMFVGIRQKEYQTWPDKLVFSDYLSLDSEIDANGQVECQVCGTSFNQLHQHLRHSHAMSVDDYKTTYNVGVINASNYAQTKYPGEMLPELARLIGYTLSEGCLAQCGAITFGNRKKTLIDDFIRCFKVCFNYDLTEFVVESDGFYSLQIKSNGIYHFFEYLGLTTDKSHTKFIPWSIFQAPKQSVIEFLKAFWEGDGSARSVNGGITFCSASFKLMKDIQLLLLSLGIPSYNSNWNVDSDLKHCVKTLGNKEYYLDMYLLMITGKHVDTFTEKIGAISDERWRDLVAIKTISQRQISSWSTCIPGAKNKIDELYQKYHYGSGNYEVNGQYHKLSLERIALMDTTELNYGHLDRYPHLISNLGKLDKEFAAKLRKIWKLGLLWEEVVVITPSAILKPVWCIKDVEEAHNFIAQGFVVHNCCSICGKLNTNIQPCTHILNKGSIFHGKLAYQLCVSSRFSETSSVTDPADVTVDTGNDPYFQFK